MKQAHESDERLMQRVADGNREPLSILMRRYANPLLTFIHRMTGDHHRSEELFQEVFLALWAGRRKYEYPRSFRAWLFGIAVNKCRADYRQRNEPLISLDSRDTGVPVVSGCPVEEPQRLECSMPGEKYVHLQTPKLDQGRRPTGTLGGRNPETVAARETLSNSHHAIDAGAPQRVIIAPLRAWIVFRLNPDAK